MTCIMCGRTDHRARGLCGACYQAALRCGNLADYPRLGPQNRSDDVLEDWAELRTQGYTWRLAAERLGMKPDTLCRALVRAKARGDDRGCRSLDDLKAWRNQAQERHTA